MEAIPATNASTNRDRDISYTLQQNGDIRMLFIVPTIVMLIIAISFLLSIRYYLFLRFTHAMLHMMDDN